MTRRITVSLPDDVADYLDRYPNVSAEVTEAVRARMNRRATIIAALRAAGVPLTDEGLARARGQFRPLTEAQKAEMQRFHDELMAGHRPESQ